jgi:hypothetical protein
VAAWIERIGLHRQARLSASRVPDAEDEIPDTLLPILKLLMADYVPILGTTVRTVLDFLAKTQKEIPRHFKPASFQLHLGEEVLADGTRNVSTHCVWMLQRILDIAYVDSARGACLEALDAVDGGSSGVARQWRTTVELWEQSGWRVGRNQRNQLVGERVSRQMRL